MHLFINASQACLHRQYLSFWDQCVWERCSWHSLRESIVQLTQLIGINWRGEEAIESLGQKSKIIEKRRRRRTKDEGLKLIDTIDFRTNERTNEGNIWPVSRISQGRWWKGNGKGGETRENARSAARLRKSHARKMGFTCHGGEDSEREDSFLFLRG